MRALRSTSHHVVPHDADTLTDLALRTLFRGRPNCRVFHAVVHDKQPLSMTRFIC